MDDQTVREMRVNLRLREVDLEGHLAVPQEPRGLIVFAHGSGGSRHSPRNRAVAKRLNENHLATLLFDLLTEEKHVADQASGRLRFDIALLARRLSETVDGVARLEETADFGYRPVWREHWRRRGINCSRGAPR